MSSPVVQGFLVGFLTFMFNLGVTMSGIIPVAELARTGGQSIAIFFYVLTYFVSGSTALTLRDFERPVAFILGESVSFFTFTVITAIILTVTLV